MEHVRLIESTQCTLKDITQLQFDLCVAASGYESRSTFVPSQVAPAQITRRVALGFADRKVLSRRDNDSWYHNTGYELLTTEGNSDSVVRQVLGETLRASERPVRVLFDYTSMTRVWYAGALDFLRSVEADVPWVDVYFSYAPSRFARPRRPMPNTHMGPVPGFSGLDIPEARSALLLGLGYEKGRAIGLSGYVEAAETFAFYADPALDAEFVGAVLRNNRSLLERLGPDRVIQYPLADMTMTAAKLGSLTLGLKAQSYRVILAPLGPKPFTFLCFLLATQHGGIDVWRVSAGVGGKTYDRPAIGEALICRARFVPASASPKAITPGAAWNGSS